MNARFPVLVGLTATAFFFTSRAHAQRGEHTNRLETADQYVLVGAITGDDTGNSARGSAVALIKHTASGRTLTRQTGQEVGGWRIEYIESNQVTITRDGQRMLIRRESFPSESSGAQGSYGSSETWQREFMPPPDSTELPEF